MLADSPVYAVVACRDLQAARGFYGETLGLKELELPDPGALAGAALYQCAESTNLLVYQRDEPNKADHTQAGWMVANIAAVVADLSAKGVQFETYELPGAEWDAQGIATTGGIKAAWFRDPEGNILSINQMG